MTPIVERQLVTPHLAKRWLEQNTHCQREVNGSKVAKMVEDMENGSWKLTHQGIAFDINDKLLDGQHRLMAVVDSGMSVEMMVAIGCDPSTFDVIDQSSNRNSGDLFTIQYKKKHNGVGPTAPKLTCSVAKACIQGVGKARATREAVSTYALKHEDEITATRLGLAKNNLVTMAVVAAFVRSGQYFGFRHLEPLVERLSTQMWTGEMDPLKALNDRLVRGKTSDNRAHRLSFGEGYMVALSAVRAALLGESRRKLETTDAEIGKSSQDRKILSILRRE